MSELFKLYPTKEKYLENMTPLKYEEPSKQTLSMLYELKAEIDQLRKDFEEYKNYKRNKNLYKESWY